MPFLKTFRDASLVDAAPYFQDVAKAEGLKAKNVEALWTALDEATRNGLIAHAKDPASDGGGLAHWRGAFPTVFAELTDKDVYALVRISVTLAGGAIVEEDGAGETVVTDTKATAKAKA